MRQSAFELTDFLPFLLSEAAEEASKDFRKVYQDRYGMLQTEWRLLFHLGRYGSLTARDVCIRARVHKTKVSRAVTALEDKGMLERSKDTVDKRREWLSLTKTGETVYQDLVQAAAECEKMFLNVLPVSTIGRLKSDLRMVAQMDGV